MSRIPSSGDLDLIRVSWILFDLLNAILGGSGNVLLSSALFLIKMPVFNLSFFLNLFWR